MGKDSDLQYYQMSCDHIRMIDRNRIKPVYNKTEVYCKKCDDFKFVTNNAKRFGDLMEGNE